jgi:hypothetical protein
MMGLPYSRKRTGGSWPAPTTSLLGRVPTGDASLPSHSHSHCDQLPLKVA